MNEFAQPGEPVTGHGADRGDDLVAAYLERVRAAAAGLEPGRRDELIADLREHIATARAELSPETEAGVRTLLDRLGDPAAIVAEASVGEVPSASSAPPTPTAPPTPAAPAKSSRVAITILIVVLALIVLVPVAVCVIGGLGFVLYQQEGPIETHGPVEEYVPAPSARPS